MIGQKKAHKTKGFQTWLLTLGYFAQGANVGTLFYIVSVTYKLF
jgi:hypothetical protein